MGLNLKELVEREKTSLGAFSAKVVAIDAYAMPFTSFWQASGGRTGSSCPILREG